MRGRSHCDLCGEQGIKIKGTFKVCGQRMCKSCYRGNRKDRRTETKNIRIGGKYADRNNFKPYYKRTRRRFTNLTMEERQVLFGQLVRSGYDELDAKIRVRNLTTFEKRLFKKIHNQVKEPEDLNKRFKEEFMKLTHGK